MAPLHACALSAPASATRHTTPLTSRIPSPRTARGSELLRETAWIIFDEVHYMQDRERGVIWEETIIFAPKCVEKVLMGERIVGDLVLEERYQGCLKGS